MTHTPEQIENLWNIFNTKHNRYIPLGKEQFVRVFNFIKAKEAEEIQAMREQIEFLQKRLDTACRSTESLFNKNNALKADKARLIEALKKSQPALLWPEHNLHEENEALIKEIESK